MVPYRSTTANSVVLFCAQTSQISISLFPSLVVDVVSIFNPPFRYKIIFLPGCAAQVKGEWLETGNWVSKHRSLSGKNQYFQVMIFRNRYKFMSSFSQIDGGFSIGFVDKAQLAYASASSSHAQQRLFCGINDMYYNLSTVNKQYELYKGGHEAMFIIEAYRTLRDRSPYPAHQVLKDLEGGFGFMIYDDKAGTFFAALSEAATLSGHTGVVETRNS